MFGLGTLSFLAGLVGFARIRADRGRVVFKNAPWIEHITTDESAKA
jgi:hypothetical protein